MDVRYFLKARTTFIRQLYDTCSAPYLERKQKIEAKEYPFVPPYSEDGEPPFLQEWIEADESLKKRKDDCILLGFYVHPISSTPFAAIVVKDPDAIIGKKYLYYCEARQSVSESVVVAASL